MESYEFSMSIMSLSIYLLVTLPSLYYYIKFIYNYCYQTKYKYLLLDDINFPENDIKSDNTINANVISDGSKLLIVGSDTDYLN